MDGVVMKKHKLFLVFSIIIIAVLAFIVLNNLTREKNVVEKKETIEKKEEKSTKEEKEKVIEDVVIKDKFIVTAVGDCTLAEHTGWTGPRTFSSVMKSLNYDYSKIFAGVQSVFANDDLTIVNLENVFTDATKPANKKFTFKSPKSYVNILTEGSVEAVNFANNHTHDYLEVGYNDTIETLKEANVAYFGYDKYHIYETKGLKIGLIGYYAVDNPNIYKELDAGLKYLKENKVDLIFVTFHWGIERYLYPLESQRELGKYAIDNGADLIIGHHPHRIQGIETYKGKHIVYSLSNFSFGGHTNPADQDTFIFQQIYDLENGKITGSTIKIIPATISSVKHFNNYQPQLLYGEDAKRALNKVLERSEKFGFEYNED